MRLICFNLNKDDYYYLVGACYLAWRFGVAFSAWHFGVVFWHGVALLLLLLLFPQSSWLFVTGAWAGGGYGRRGSWLGCG